MRRFLNFWARRPKIAPKTERAVRAELVRLQAGRAGVLASIVMAVLGVVLGASAVYIGGHGASVSAARIAGHRDYIMRAPETGPQAAYAVRANFVSELASSLANERVALAGPAPQRAEARLAPASLDPEKPKIIIIFDDMGLDKQAFERVMALPGPVTFSFLPYADGLQSLSDRANARGDAVLLHLPMAPLGSADPGPHSLRSGMTGAELMNALSWNLNRFDGFIGVNNHMGSAFTADIAGMKTVLSVLREAGLFFVDSLTTPDSVAFHAGDAVGARVFARDVFLDPDLDRKTVYKQLKLVEEIARQTGFAVAICHPRPDTIDVLGPWLTSAPARGFELATVQALVDRDARLRHLTAASTPEG